MCIYSWKLPPIFIPKVSSFLHPSSVSIWVIPLSNSSPWMSQYLYWSEWMQLSFLSNIFAPFYASLCLFCVCQLQQPWAPPHLKANICASKPGMGWRLHPLASPVYRLKWGGAYLCAYWHRTYSLSALLQNKKVNKMSGRPAQRRLEGSQLLNWKMHHFYVVVIRTLTSVY